MGEQFQKVTIFTEGCGSNDGDFSGKLQFRNCSMVTTSNCRCPEWLNFVYKTKGGTGKEAHARFNLKRVYGYLIEDEE